MYLKGSVGSSDSKQLRPEEVLTGDTIGSQSAGGDHRVHLSVWSEVSERLAVDQSRHQSLAAQPAQGGLVALPLPPPLIEQLLLMFERKWSVLQILPCSPGSSLLPQLFLRPGCPHVRPLSADCSLLTAL